MDIQPIITILLYIAATLLLAANVFNILEKFTKNNLIILILGIFALSLHADILNQSIFLQTGFDVGFFNIISIIGWLVALIVLITSFFQPIQQLLLVLYPIAAITIPLEQLFPSDRILDQSLPMGLRIHILLSISAYSLLMIGTLQALLLAVQDKFIKSKQISKIIDILPPLQIMEQLLIQIIVIGFFLLSLSLTTGIMFIDNLFEQHLIHKTTLSMLAWMVYAILLWGRWSLGWRGRRITRWVLVGFIILILAYTGSKFVLELLLQRV